jgi:hypothetical protein
VTAVVMVRSKGGRTCHSPGCGSEGFKVEEGVGICRRLFVEGGGEVKGQRHLKGVCEVKLT